MATNNNLGALISLLSWWEAAGYAGLAIVIIGVVGEGIHDFTAWLKRTWWGPNGGRLSVLVLIVGLAIEGVAQVKANSISGQIIGSLNKEAADERARTAEIEKVAAWRRLEPENEMKLTAALAAIPSSIPHKIVFAYAENDPESLYFLYQIGRSFLANGSWNVNIEAELHPGMLYWGVRILGRQNETTRSVRKAFTEAGIAFTTDAVPGGFHTFGYTLQPDDTIISVGPKKPPFEP
jgi:hypothetical protein